MRMTTINDLKQRPGRSGERGVALITTLLISTLLLMAGGALILTTAMSSTNTVDATAEMHAYYAAEAGLQAAFNVLRHSTPRVSWGQALTSGNLAYNATNLPQGLAYNASGRVDLGPNAAFSISITNPDPGTMTSRLRVQVTGYGYSPRVAIKRLTVIILMIGGNPIIPPATISAPGSPLTVALGSSSAKGYTGQDPSTGLLMPSFAVNTSQQTTTQTAADSYGNVTGPVVGLSGTDWPTTLQSPLELRSFVAGMKYEAQITNRYFTSTPSTLGTATKPLLTFIDNNTTFGPSASGAGLLIVTGDLTLKGSWSWKGLIIVAGTGKLYRDGGGSGQIEGAVITAQFDNTSNTFGAVTFDTSGGGTSDIIYNKSYIDMAFKTVTFTTAVLGVVEN